METYIRSREKQDIIDSYLEYFEAYTARDWDRMVATFANEFTMIGTGIDEVSSTTDKTLNLYKREFSQAPIPMKYNIREIEAQLLTPDTAYVTVLMDMCFMCDENPIQCPNNRTTAIMVRQENRWKLAHGHWSQPAEGQEVGESIPYKLLKEQNKILEERVAERTKEIERQNSELKSLSELKTKLLSVISHDLRSPFNAFMGLTEIMLINFDEHFSNPEYFKTRLNLIKERAQNLYTVADNLLNWAWTQSEVIMVNKKWIMIDDLIKSQIETLDDVAKAKGIKFKLKLPDKMLINTDPEILGIIIRNFISNAIKYSYKGGTVVITTKKDTSNVTITFADKGIGIPKDKLDRLINTNTIESNLGTEKEKGTGLGIQICKELIARIDGTFHIESTPNFGTTAYVLLPAS